MDVFFKINNPVLRAVNKEMLTALEQTADQMYSNIVVRGKMPFEHGDMQNVNTSVDTSELKKKKVSIVTTSPQARRLYFHPEYNFYKKKNRNAGGLWWQDYIDGEKKDFAENTYEKLLRKRLKNL